MEKHITDERTGLKYDLVEDCYPIIGDDELVERHTARFICDNFVNSIGNTAD